MQNRTRASRLHQRLRIQGRQRRHSQVEAGTTPERSKPLDRTAAADQPPVEKKWLTTQGKLLDEHPTMPRWLKWFLRWVYERYAFAANETRCKGCGAHAKHSFFSIEYRGAFDEEGDARWAANCAGGRFRPIPYNAALPEQSVQYGVPDVPQSEASPFYRHCRQPFTAVLTDDLDLLPQLEQAVRELHSCALGECRTQAGI